MYYRVEPSVLVPVSGVTSVVHIIDKSGPLVGWSAKKVAERILEETPIAERFVEGTTKSLGWYLQQHITLEEFTRICMDAKLAPREHLEEAGDIGHQAHKWLEGYIQRELGIKQFHLALISIQDEKVQSCCKASLDWMGKHNVRWLKTERIVYSKSFGYAGTLDGLALVDSCNDRLCCPVTFKDRRSLIDWKSSNYLYPEYLLQTAAYQYAEEEEFGITIDDRWIIRLGKEDGKFESWHIEKECFTQDFEAFIHALQLYRTFNAIIDRMGTRRDYIKAETKRIKQEQKAEEKAAKEAAKAALAETKKKIKKRKKDESK